MSEAMWIEPSTWSRIQFQYLEEHLSKCSHAERQQTLLILRPAARSALLILASENPFLANNSTSLNGPKWCDVMDPWSNQGLPALQEASPTIRPVIGNIIRDLVDDFATGPVTEEEAVSHYELITEFIFLGLANR